MSAALPFRLNSLSLQRDADSIGISPRASQRRAGHPGFTLVELLVVITIIVVLAALSLVGFQRMRNSADKVTSTRNLSQLQLANINHATENNGMYCPVFSTDENGVSTGDWWRNAKFLGFLLGGEVALNPNGTVATKVPSGLLETLAFRSKKQAYNSLHASYGYCNSGIPGAGFGGISANRAFRVTQVGSPERSAAFFTATDWLILYASCKQVWTTPDYQHVEGFAGNQRFAPRSTKASLSPTTTAMWAMSRLPNSRRSTPKVVLTTSSGTRMGNKSSDSLVPINGAAPPAGFPC